MRSEAAYFDAAAAAAEAAVIAEVAADEAAVIAEVAADEAAVIAAVAAAEAASVAGVVTTVVVDAGGGVVVVVVVVSSFLVQAAKETAAARVTINRAVFIFLLDLGFVKLSGRSWGTLWGGAPFVKRQGSAGIPVPSPQL